MLTLKPPYCIFLGDVPNMAYAKTAFGIVQWAPQACVSQLRFPGCPIDAGLPDSDIQQAKALGAKSLLIGSAPVGGAIQDNWLPVLLEALAAGMDIISGLHTRLGDFPALVAAAQQSGARLIDVRVPPDNLPIAKGKKRSGKRLLTVGSDCSVGKKYTAMAITQQLKAQSINCDFRATGQTGIMIAGSGIPIDAVVADFIAGAAETLSPANADNHWDIIEGQGSLFQPAYAGVSLGLLHGSQPDAIVVCHDPDREHIIGCPDHSLPTLQHCIDTNLQLARLTNPAVICVGVSLNTSTLAADRRSLLLHQLQQNTGLPCVDPLIDGVKPIVEYLFNATGRNAKPVAEGIDA
jgi:uncharacterized NAD-dependent epimerase/dehydratase family protein